MRKADRWRYRLKRGQPLSMPLQVFPQDWFQNGGALNAWPRGFSDLHRFGGWLSASGKALADSGVSRWLRSPIPTGLRMPMMTAYGCLIAQEQALTGSNGVPHPLRERAPLTDADAGQQLQAVQVAGSMNESGRGQRGTPDDELNGKQLAT